MKRFDRSFISLLVFAGAFFLFTGCAEVHKQSLDASYYTKRGVECQLNGESEQALSDYSKADQRQLEFPTGKIVDVSHKAIEIDPKHAEAYFNRGLACAQCEDTYDQAISDFSKVIELDPEHALAYNNRGFLFMNHGQYDQAIADFDMAITVNPQYFRAYYNRGIAWQSKGEYNRAIADYSVAILVDPRHALPYNNRGTACHHKGQYDQAIADYNKAIELDPEYALAYFNRGVAYFKRGDCGKAWVDFRNVQGMGYQISPELFEQLRKACGEGI